MTYNENHEEKKQFYKLAFSLVLPMALQNLINTGISAADVIMLGKVGETALSASSLAGQVQFILSLILFGLTSGASVLTAQYWGKKDIHTIEKVMGITLRFALTAAILFTVVVMLFPVPVMRLFSNENDVVEQGARYLRIIAFSYVLTAITMIYLNIMRSVERVIISTIVYLASFLTNVMLNAILIFGMFGFAPMGIQGAALATLTAKALELGIVFIYAVFINKTIRLHIKDLFIKDKLLRRDFFIYSIPVMLNELIWGTGTSVNAAIIGHLGKSVVAANSVMQVTRQLAMVAAFGIASATAIVLGKTIGAGQEEKAKLYAKRFIRLTILLGIIGGFVILISAQIAGQTLSLSKEAKNYLGVMMFVMTYFAIAQAYNTTMVVGVFRAGGDINFGLILDSTTMWCGSILCGALAAFVFKLPVPVVYIILMSDEVIKLPLTTWRYKTMKWLKNVTR